MGKVFPCGQATVSADPFYGETPQHPLRVRGGEGISVTGGVSKERLSAPVMEFFP